jgi:hypothetical protein
MNMAVKRKIPSPRRESKTRTPISKAEILREATARITYGQY